MDAAPQSGLESGRMSRPHSEGSCRPECPSRSLPPLGSSFLSFIISLFLNVFVLLMLCGLWDPGSLTRNQTYAPCIGAWTLSHWTTSSVPLPACFWKELCRAGALQDWPWPTSWSATVAYVWKQVPRGWAFRQEPLLARPDLWPAMPWGRGLRHPGLQPLGG